MANSTTAIDWEALREEGLNHLQALSGHLWTDYNLHDPGVTLLELLCYAITDLNERLALDIADLVTENTPAATTEHFFSPGSILTVNPVTINDFRKLVIDLPGVKNAWIEAVTAGEPALYFDPDNDALLYDYGSGAQKLSLNGLYRVYVEGEEDVTDSGALKKTVLQKLHDHRNLGEDFVEVHMMENQIISVFSDIQIAENADAHEVMAQIYYGLKNLISPRIKQYSLQRMLQKGKSIEELFTGPLLENGFIDDDELEKGKKVKELHSSDLIGAIMANEAVKDVRNLFISNTLNPDVRDKQEWALEVDDTKALRLEPFNPSKLRLFKDETLCPVNPATVQANVDLLETAAQREIYDDPARDLSESLSEIPDGLNDYQTMAYRLPANYGVGETGLPSTATDDRRSQARQLRVYLSFFEQILVNYLNQLNSFKRLFAFRQDRSRLLKSYFSRLLPEELWREDYPDYLQLIFTPPINERFGAIVESVVLNVVVNAENERVEADSFTVVAGVNTGLSASIWNYLKDQGYIDADGNVLPAFNPGAADFVFDVDLEAVQTKFAAEIGRILADYYYRSASCVRENAFTGIGGVDEAHSQAIRKYLSDLKYLESDGKVGFPDPTENLPFCAPAFNRKNRILDHLLAQFNERFADYALFDYRRRPFVAVQATDKEEFYLKSKADFLEGYPELSRDRNRAYNYRTGATGDLPTDGLKNLIAAKLGIDRADPTEAAASEEFHIIEHILLRPRPTGLLDFLCSETIDASHQPDPYSYQLTFVLPKQGGRFGNSKFKELAYHTIANETPAHVTYSVLEFDTAEMNVFTECYQHYLLELVKWHQGRATDYHLYRKQLMGLLGIGEPKLPVLHLDAADVTGDGTTPAHGSAVTQWTDLSGNNHHALTPAGGNPPRYRKSPADTVPWLQFDETSGLKIANPLFGEDFSIAVVFRTVVQTGHAETPFSLVAGVEAASAGFALGFMGNGDLFAGVGSQTLTLESEAVSPHLAICSYDSAAREFSLTLNGALELKQPSDSITLDHAAVTIGAGAPCEVGEVIILDSGLSGTKKTKLEEYLAAKWSVPLSAVSSVARPLLHLDAANAASITKTDLTNRVSRWGDVSLNKSAVTQRMTTLQPVYDLDGIGKRPALSFRNSALTLPDPEHRFFKTDFTLALVYQAEAGGGRLLDGMATDSQTEGFAIGVGPKGALRVEGAAGSLKLPATLGTAHIVIVTGRVTADAQLEVTIWLDGQAKTAREFADPQMFSNCPADWVIGDSRNGNSAFTGKIGEIVIFDEVLSVWDRQRLEDFWAGKWRIDISGVDSVAAAVLHLDASRQAVVLDETGAVIARETPVSKWLDLGAEGNDGVQDNPSRRPCYTVDGIHGLGAVKFTQQPKDTDDYYDDALNVDRMIQQDFTIMVVFKADAAYYAERNIPAAFSRETVWTEGVALLDADCSGHYNDFGLSFAETGSKLVLLGGIGDRVTVDHTLQSEAIDLYSPHFVTLTREKAGGLVKLYVDGRLHAGADLRDGVTLNDARTIKIGAFNSGEGLPYHGMIGEVVIFDQVLNDVKRRRIENYLATKWEIPVVTLPLDTTGLSLHLDAADPDSITRDPEQRIAQWADQNPQNEIAALQPVAEYQPVYLASGSCGPPAVSFNDSFMTVAPAFTSYDELTLALVYTAFSTGNVYPGWEGGAGLVDHYAVDGSGNFGVVTNRNGTLGMRIGAQQVEAACGLNAPHIAIVTRSKTAGAAKIYLDGLLAASGDGAPETALNELDDWCLGAIRPLSGETVSPGYYHGELSEVVLFNRVVTPAERQSLEAYSAAKWGMDLSGIKNIATPALHLDAAILSTVIAADGGKVAQWLDRNGRNNHAVQAVLTQQPEYRPAVYRELGAIHFDRSRRTCLTLGPTVTDDFAIFIVYQAEPSDPSDYMPVAPDSFTAIAGVDPALSAQIWTHFKNKGYIDAEGKVLAAFTPGTDQFEPGLAATILQPIQSEFERGIGVILTEYYNSNTIAPEIVFTAIGGVDAELSASIWQYLYGANYLNSDGRVLNAMFTSQTGPEFRAIIAAVVVNVVLTQNWLKGAGLFDGNCAGETGQLNKRDFGLLVGKDGQLLAGIGVPDEGDYQLARTAAFSQWHLGVFTRVKNTGVTRLYLDGAAPAVTRVARDVSLKDAKRFTIGAENNGGNYFNGDIGEIIVFDTVPDDNQVAVIQSYLAHKWGIEF